jgi:exodeoxyribonuclease VII small subunit
VTDTSPSTRAAEATPQQQLPAAPRELSSLLFDEALEELRGVVARLEAGGLPLEQSIDLYERGAALHEHCAQLLDSAEARIGRLVDGSGGPRLVDLRPDDVDES